MVVWVVSGRMYMYVYVWMHHQHNLSVNYASFPHKYSTLHTRTHTPEECELLTGVSGTLSGGTRTRTDITPKPPGELTESKFSIGGCFSVPILSFGLRDLELGLGDLSPFSSE